MKPSNKSNSIKILILGYLLLVIFMTSVLYLDSSLLENQINTIDTSDSSTKKIQTIVDLMEIARTRVRLAHKMLATEDIFEKDEIAQDISALATKFVQKNDELVTYELNQTELDILEKQRKDYPQVIQKLNLLKGFAFEDTLEGTTKARNIIIYEIVPLQETVIDRFILMIKNIQNEISKSRETALIRYEKNEYYRNIFIILAFLASVGVLIWVIFRTTLIEKQLHSYSLIDALTGIANRRHFDEKLRLEWTHCKRNKNPLSLLLIDIDYFKKYNDFYGHQEGDKCLQQVANIIKGFARRETDLAARYGGEEFAIILPFTDRKEAEKIAMDLITKVNNEKIPHEKSEIGNHLTLSIGISESNQVKDNETYEVLTKIADKALYLSKERGRNQANLFNE
ncbi:MAG: GGDEF domain-containing protein [Gammaproteobacteria bacterium]|jgi:diguanylate cyclase (GGDEF)-like protein